MNNFFPEHLGEAFCKVFKEKYEYRLSIKKDKSMSAIAGGWKQGLNGTSGNIQSEYSYFLNIKCALQMRINGQLLLMMCIEEILTTVEEVVLIQANTDGFTF